jgi:hypothetical protein
MLGISSYLVTFSLLSSGVLPVDQVVQFLGWTEADLQKYGIEMNSKLVTFAMTIAVVKGLDLMGLVPLRWALTIFITPKVARYIGPYVDSMVGMVKRNVKLFK